MSKKFKSQASSSRAATIAFTGFGTPSTTFGSSPFDSASRKSSLSYIAEPLDLSTISHPNIVVAFKNLSKRDIVTKAKALEDIHDFIASEIKQQNSLDDGLLEAWMKVYPRLSIEISRKIRQIAHTVHGEIVSSCGKRVARQIPNVIGAWLAGLYDNEKPVFLAAQASFMLAFTTDEKRQGVWKIYQSSILDFIEDAILVQTPSSLSDERSVNQDDAKAKHSRVVATASQLFNRLLARLSPHDLEKNYGKLSNLLANKKLWAFAHHEDAFLRRCIYNLLRSIIGHTELENFLDWNAVGSTIICKSMSTSQIGSSTQFIELLVALTKRAPDLWTAEYGGKRSPAKRFLQYVREGSELGTVEYWQNLDNLVQIIPSGIFTGTANGAQTYESASTLANVLHHPILNSHESRVTLPAAWQCYVSTTLRLAQAIENKDDQIRFVQEHLIPIVENYVHPSKQNDSWRLPTGVDLNLSARILIDLARHSSHVFIEFWTSLVINLIRTLKESAPEQSGNYQVSQDAICSQASSLFSLQALVSQDISKMESCDFELASFAGTTVSLSHASLDILKSRHGKPYGAAAVIQEMLSHTPESLYSNDSLDAFLKEDIPPLLSSPSGSRLISILFSCRARESFGTALNETVESLLDQDLDLVSVSVLRQLFSSITVADLSKSTKFEALVMKDLDTLLTGKRQEWTDIATLLMSSASDGALSDLVMSRIMKALHSDKEIFHALQGLSYLFASDVQLVHKFMDGKDGTQLVARLLSLSESAEDLSALDLASSLRDHIQNVSEKKDTTGPSIKIIQNNLNDIGPQTISVASMLNISHEILSKMPHEEHGKMLPQILPGGLQWSHAIRPFYTEALVPSEAITSELQGLIYVISRPGSGDLQSQRVVDLSRDMDGLTWAARLYIYVTKLLSSLHESVFSDLSSNEPFVFFLPIITRLLDHSLSSRGSKGSPSLYNPSNEEECVESIGISKGLIQKYLLFANFWERKLDLLQGTSPETFYNAEGFLMIFSEQTLNSREDCLRKAKESDSSRNPFILSAVVAASRETLRSNPLAVRVCNDLVADLSQIARFETSDAIRKLVQLRFFGEAFAHVQNQRLVILFNRLVDFLDNPSSPLGVTYEVLMVLKTIAPLIQEIFGSHWQSVLESLSTIWDKAEVSDEYIPVINGSLRLFATLRSLVKNGSNDDLEEALSEIQQILTPKLIRLLTRFNFSSLAPSQPVNITADLLSHQISSLSTDQLEDLTEVFSSLSVQNTSIQSAAFDVLHRTIPKRQEALSVEAALSEVTAKIPDELLSLLSRAPSGQSIADTYEYIPSDLHSYTLSWKVTFDHFSSASVPIQEQYVADLKEKGYLDRFLDFTFEALQQRNGTFVSASQFDVHRFRPNESNSGQEELQQVLIHLYYLSLKYLPNLAKSWWIESKKSIKGQVESWTEKYISPLVIEESLQSVSQWYSEQDFSTEDYPMEVKVMHKAAEIVANIEIDDDLPPTSISISLPPNYPLQQALVIGRSRVAVDDKKWKSWLLTIQGAIMFSNGNLADGLLTFRRNVQGALKGQTECAICYSVVSTTMQTPNKRCATCKNMFHSTCLYKWFKSSNASGCPLCRSSFMYS